MKKSDNYSVMQLITLHSERAPKEVLLGDNC